VLERGDDLSHNVPNHILLQRSALLPARFDQAGGKGVSGKIQKKSGRYFAISLCSPGQIARRTELHDDVERRLLPVDDAVVVFHNVRVPQPLQQIDLGHQKRLRVEGAARIASGSRTQLAV